jgi:membrane-bound metal-dependent hydrolase YbcI (DUF457 family)
MGIALLVMYGLNPELNLSMINLWFIAGGCIGSYLPDCDHPYALAGQIIPLHWFVKHRTITHSLYMCVVFAVLAAVINPMFGLGIAFGYILHLAGDRTTYMGRLHGLPYLLWPMKIKRGA